MNSNVLIKRQQKLKQILRQAGIDALALNPGSSLTYLTGLHFHLSERPVAGFFGAEGPNIIILPELESIKLTAIGFAITAYTYGEQPDTWAGIFREALNSNDLSDCQIGVEPRQMRLLEHDLIKNALPGATICDGQNIIASLRVIKSEEEISSMQKAAIIAELGLQAALKNAKHGMTEREFAAELTLQLLRHGSDPQLPFSPIIASGPNSANPHATPTDRQFQDGDLIVVDWGAAANEYFSDITRTFYIGTPAQELLEIGEIVHAANQAGRVAAKPGMTCASVDHAARQVIEQAGYGKNFLHRTGHGLGMEGHEEPYIRGDNQQILQPGMAFTIEPGIYLEGRGGVRIEDDVVITTDGLLCLTNLPRQVLPMF